MKRFTLILLATCVSGIAFSQTTDAQTFSANGATADGKGKQKQMEALKATNANENKIDLLEITGLNGLVFNSMNYPDVSSRGISHSMKITLSLLTGATKATGYQLVFFPANETIQYAVETQNGTTSINLSMNTFETIQQKLEQYLAAKKKVQLKITQNPNGYREGLVIF